MQNERNIGKCFLFHVFSQKIGELYLLYMVVRFKSSVGRFELFYYYCCWCLGEKKQAFVQITTTE